MKIKFKNVYYPHGEWFDEFGQKVQVKKNFRGRHNDRDVICVQTATTSGPSHGEPSETALRPVFIDAETLLPISITDFIEVDPASLE